MQLKRNDQRHLWLLSGTGEGPSIANALIQQGWEVSVSVVTKEAACAYEDIPLAAIWIGELAGVSRISQLLVEKRIHGQGFEWVIDATHPFATAISAAVQIACKATAQPLLRFERPLEGAAEQTLLGSINHLSSLDLRGHRLLMAIGSRHLSHAVAEAQKAGARVFARVLPCHHGLQKALTSGLSGEDLAVMRPIKGDIVGHLEAALCRRWRISTVLSRQSGGSTELLWQSVCQRQGLQHLKIARPLSFGRDDLVTSLDELLHRVRKEEILNPPSDFYES